jgi:2',3'-cyclic-nucleotide 2'-phosphodiesterase (5'-nucleotidase family)
MTAQAEALRKEGADFVVGVAHVTRTEGYAVLDTGLFDLLLTGHTHDLFINYNGRCAMVESNHDAHYVTVIDLRLEVKTEGSKRVVAWWPEFRVIDTATVMPDPEVAAVVAGYETQLSLALDRPIGTTAVELDSRTMTVRTREAAIGALIADAMRASTHAQAAVTNGGGIRGGRIYAPGTAITRRDIVAELPFDNRVVAIDISGATLRLAIENGLSQLPKPAGRFPQVSGLAIEADPSRPPGSRVLSMKVDGEPLNETRIYRIATNDYMQRGGDDYTMFIDAPELLDAADAPLLTTDVIEYIEQIGTIRTEVGDRLVLK